MRVGLFGFGRTGKAVATILLQNEEVHLWWVVRKSKILQHRSVPDFLGIQDNEQGVIYSLDEWTPKRLLDEHRVDTIIDFSSDVGILSYGNEAARRGINIVTVRSAYRSKTIEFLNKLSRKTRVIWSPIITIGINFLMMTDNILRRIAPFTKVEIIEEHF